MYFSDEKVENLTEDALPSYLLFLAFLSLNNPSIIEEGVP